MNIVNKARRILVNAGKMLPFALCFIVCLTHIEVLWAVATDSYFVYGDTVIIATPITNYIGAYFEYDLLTLVIVLTISVAVETCYWNKLAIVYLCLQLYEKDYFSNIELYQETICLVALANVIASGFFVYKGIRIIIK